jgi:UDP-N-acetylglucosamine 1-carboxyvinyltransferase
MRASILGARAAARAHGEARVVAAGRLRDRLRPVDQHVKGLQAMGAEIDLTHGYINARAKRLTGAHFRLRRGDGHGTENLMMAARSRRA